MQAAKIIGLFLIAYSYIFKYLCASVVYIVYSCFTLRIKNNNGFLLSD